MTNINLVPSESLRDDSDGTNLYVLLFYCSILVKDVVNVCMLVFKNRYLPEKYLFKNVVKKWLDRKLKDLKK